jgi:hypothetical protein
MPSQDLQATSYKHLPPIEGKRTDYLDSGCPGLILRVSATGGRSWSVLYRHRGRKRRYTLGPALKLAAARAEARRILAVAALGGDPEGDKRSGRLDGALTVAEMAKQAMAALVLRPSTHAEWAFQGSHASMFARP